MKIEVQSQKCVFCKHFDFKDTQGYSFCKKTGLDLANFGQGAYCEDFADYSENKGDLDGIPQTYVLSEAGGLVGFDKRWFYELTKERQGLIGYGVNEEKAGAMPFKFFRKFDAEAYCYYLQKEYPHKRFFVVEERKIDL